MRTPSHRFVLRNLPLASRLLIAAFLVTVGVGYFSALVQLHFQHASPGKLLPDTEDTTHAYSGRSGMSQLERLLVLDEGKPFNGGGSMRRAFTAKSGGWRSAINRRAKTKNISLRQAEEQLRSERDGERLAVLDWVRSGASRKAFEEDGYVLSGRLGEHPITEDFVERSPSSPPKVKIASIFETRCLRCHRDNPTTPAGQFPLENWEQIHGYCEVQTNGSGVSLPKLAQSTHIHLLGFAMLYGLTGLAVSLTSYPGWFRGLLALWPLLAQFVDISFWWLARIDPQFSKAIMITGCIVATGLFLQIGLSLFDLFGKTGKVVLLVLALAAALGGYEVKQRLIDPYLAREAVNATVGD